MKKLYIEITANSLSSLAGDTCVHVCFFLSTFLFLFVCLGKFLNRRKLVSKDVNLHELYCQELVDELFKNNDRALKSKKVRESRFKAPKSEKTFGYLSLDQLLLPKVSKLGYFEFT